MKELFNEQNILLVSASTLFTYFQVPVGFIALLSTVMLIDFLTGISKDIVLGRELSISIFWVGLLKKMTLIGILMMFGLVVLAAKTTALNYPDNSTVKGILESINADYAVIFAFWIIFLNEILSVLCNAKMITTGEICKKANVVELLGRYIESMLYRLLPFERREVERRDDG
ncbi:phage holin family protein [Sulfurospirillum cavolei]|uniref:phage holin family protein n=1 Tax=Sulfurospirillum cavolei TaxID=366522 RepID=UPI003FA236EA